MKIGIPILVYNKTGGIERHTAELTEALSNIHEIHIFTTHWNPNDIPKNVFFHKIYAFGPNFIKIPLFTILSTISTKFYGLDLIINDGAGATFNQDILIAESSHLAWAKETQYERNNKLLLHPLHYWTFFIEGVNYHFHRYKKIIAISNFIKKHLIKYYNLSPLDIEVIYHGVNVQEFKRDEKIRTKIRNRLGISKKDFVLLFIGKEYERKGLIYILEAMKNIKENQIKLIIVGKDNSKRFKNLSNEINDKRIYFMGHSNNVKDYYSASDLFVFPSSFDAFGMVVTEATAAGLPVITSNTTGAGELIQKYRCGLILKNRKNSNEIKQLILKLYYHKKLYSVFSKNTKYISKLYDWKSVIHRTEILLNKVYREKTK